MSQPQIKQLWLIAGSDTGYPADGLLELRAALKREVAPQASRLEHLKNCGKNGRSAFMDLHARLTALVFLLLSYDKTRGRAGVAAQKWKDAKSAVLDLQHQLPEHLKSAPIFAKLETMPVSRPRPSRPDGRYETYD